ncbi:hypothetical protein LQ948_06520 [Jiella sp. MQZ9-1]|uniref:MFS transporter n=1 Tax=Jiella flava TaxID=2816857 RepID=A0A939FX11_9HYPH|nr:hypothetical protein [Jiella flava]MBO0662311.1 hypothetical protein [Jiella flava]MCD2470858.1 hypothetical protein [Jiella flava]
MKTSLAPALVGHAFQQTAILAMLPLIASRLGLSNAAVGAVVATGMAMATMTIPLMGLVGSRRLVPAALVAMLVCSIGLVLLLLVDLTPAIALAGLLVLRLVQGMSAATVLVAAQTASLDDAATARHRLAATQSFAGIGRAASAVLVGPLVAISVVLPMLPAMFGGLWSLARLNRNLEDNAVADVGGFMPPDLRALILPALVQASLGATHVSLAPLLAAQPHLGDLSAATYAGFALAAANLGLLVAHRFLTAKVELAGMRVAAGLGGAALLVIALLPAPALVVALSGIVGATSAILLTRNLFGALSRSKQRGTSQAAWNATVSTGGLALGALIGSAGLTIGPSLSVALSAGLMASALLALTPTRKTAT